MGENSIQKPLTLRKEEYMQILTQATNDSGLPMFIIEYVLKELLLEVSSLAKEELKMSQEQYNKILEKQNKISEQQDGISE